MIVATSQASMLLREACYSENLCSPRAYVLREVCVSENICSLRTYVLREPMFSEKSVSLGTYVLREPMFFRRSAGACLGAGGLPLPDPSFGLVCSSYPSYVRPGLPASPKAPTADGRVVKHSERGQRLSTSSRTFSWRTFYVGPTED